MEFQADSKAEEEEGIESGLLQGYGVRLQRIGRWSHARV